MLASFILTCFFFLANQDCGATGVFEGKLVVKGAQINDDATAISEDFAIRTTSKQQRCAAGFHPDFFFETSWEPGFYPTSILLQQRYSYCTSIGQKLLYPKHYFW